MKAATGQALWDVTLPKWERLRLYAARTEA
jgi:hypothetical protein